MEYKKLTDEQVKRLNIEPIDWSLAISQTPKNMYYYELHVSIDKKNGYSIAVKSENPLNDENVIEQAISEKKFEEISDCNLVDYIGSITEEEYETF